MKFYYKGFIDKEPVEVTIIQFGDKGKRVEVIRTDRIYDRKSFAGFWVNTNELT